MSVATMVDLGMQRQHEVNTAVARSASGDQTPPAKSGGGVDAALSKLTAFVPSEVVGLYVAGLGTIAPATIEGKWIIFFICMALIPLFMLLNYFTQKKLPDRQNLPVWKWGVLLVFALIAFAAWAAALPATPFLAFGEKATSIAGFAVLVLAALMYQIAGVLNLVPK